MRDVYIPSGSKSDAVGERLGQMGARMSPCEMKRAHVQESPDSRRHAVPLEQRREAFGRLYPCDRCKGTFRRSSEEAKPRVASGGNPHLVTTSTPSRRDRSQTTR